MVKLEGKISESSRYHEDLLHSEKIQNTSEDMLLHPNNHTHTQEPDSRKNYNLLEHSRKLSLKASRGKLISE